MADLKKGARITGTQRDKLANDLKKKYEKGASIRSLAESTGRSYGSCRRESRGHYSFMSRHCSGVDEVMSSCGQS